MNQALDHELILEKVHRELEFSQEVWLKPYIDMNTALKTKAKNGFEKEIFKLINYSVFGKTMEHARKHRDIKISSSSRA